MSMEERCQKFHTDAQSTKNRGSEIDRLRKFLYKNQEHRFTEREQSHLFQAVQVHVTVCTSAPGASPDDNPALPLLQDALAMPFTVFTTSHKKSFLKWLDKAQGGGEKEGAGAASSKPVEWSVCDLTEQAVSLMDDEGNEKEVKWEGGSEVYAEVKRAFEEGKAVRIVLNADGSRITKVASTE